MSVNVARAEADSSPQRLAAYIEERIGEFDQIPAERKAELERLAEHVRESIDRSREAKLTFICTHNSRRSHMAQIWTSVAADRYHVYGVQTFSGGTEVTAFNPRAVAALRRAGLQIEPEQTESDNPRYRVRFSDSAEPLVCFSKIFDGEPNPQSDYAAVMTCSHADENCPTAKGCDFRVAIPYEDPKAFDGMPQEAEAYDERSAQIAREMLYMMSRVAG